MMKEPEQEKCEHEWSWTNCEKHCIKCCYTPLPKEEEWEKEFDLMTENHIKSLHWSEEATDYQKSLVIGNIRGFAGKVKQDIADLPNKLLSSQRTKILQEKDRIVEDTVAMEIDRVLQEIEKWANEYDSTRGVSQSDSYQIGQNHGRQEAIRDLLSLLTSKTK